MFLQLVKYDQIKGFIGLHTVYVINFILPFFYYIIAKLSRFSIRQQNVLILFLYSIQVTLIVGTRTILIGHDTPSYFWFYEAVKSDNLTIQRFSYFEPLFTATAEICALIGLDFTGFSIVIAGLTMLFFSKAVIKTESNAFFCIYLYTVFSFFHNMMNQTRQAAALAIVFYAVTFLNERKNKKFIFWIIVASLFHSSALIALILLPLWNVKISKKALIRYFVVSIIIVIFSSTLIRILLNTNIRVAHYLVESRYSEFSLDAVLNLIVRLVFLIVSLLFFKELYDKNKNINGYYHMALICTVIQILCTINSAFGRATTYFFFAYIIIFPEIIMNSTFVKKNRYFVYVVFLSSFFMYYVVYSGIKGTLSIYQSTWFV